MNFLINTALLKEQLKRFWTISALLLLVYILFVILPIYQWSYDQFGSARNMIDLIAMKNPVIIISSIAAPLITVFLMFSYLFQTNSSTVMHSFPFSKKQLWITNALAGLLLIVIPLFILSLFLLSPVKWIEPEMLTSEGGISYYRYTVNLPSELFPIRFYDGMIINTLPVVAGFFIRTLLTIIFYFAVFLISAMVSGNAVIYVLVGAVLPFIPSALFVLSQMVKFYYCFGYDLDYHFHFAGKLITITNPVLLPTLFNYYSTDGTGPIGMAADLSPYILGYIVITLVLLGISYWCNLIREQERTDNSIVFTPLKNALVFLLSLLGMIMMGVFFLMIFKSITIMHLGFIIGFVLAYFIAQMVAEKTFNILGKTRDLVKFGGITMALFIAVYMVYTFDLSGYSAYAPKIEEIKGVSLGHTYRNYDGIYYGEDIKDSLLITNPEFISNVAAIHNEIIANKEELRRVFLRNLSGQYSRDYQYGQISSQNFVYTLNDGKTVSRYYTLPKSFKESIGLDTLLMTDDAITASYISLKRPEIIDKITVYYAENVGGSEKQESYTESIYIEKPEQIKSILEEIKKDVIIAAREREAELENSESATKSKEAQADAAPTISITGHVYLKESKSDRPCDYFYFENSDNTKAWLVKNGYLR